MRFVLILGAVLVLPSIALADALSLYSIAVDEHGVGTYSLDGGPATALASAGVWYYEGYQGVASYVMPFTFQDSNSNQTVAGTGQGWFGMYDVGINRISPRISSGSTTRRSVRTTVW